MRWWSLAVNINLVRKLGAAASLGRRTEPVDETKRVQTDEMARTPPALSLLALSCLLVGQTVSYPAASVLRHAEEYLIKYGYLSEAQGDVKTAVR